LTGQSSEGAHGLIAPMLSAGRGVGRGPRRTADADLGTRLRAFRQDKGLTLRQVAERAGISESFLSQAERNQTNASVSTLLKIADALGESLGTIFRTETRTVGNVVRAAERPLLAQRVGQSTDVLLTPVAATTMQVIQSTIEPGFDSGTPYSHVGAEEFVVVTSGELELESSGEVIRLHDGDSVLIDPMAPHSYRNTGNVPCRCIWVTSMPHH
jgi:transcriptional regulator with XRE-family HTH domain